MAKVEMTGFEYAELLDKQRELEALKQSMIDAMSIRIDEDDNSPRIWYTFNLPEDVQQAIAKRVIVELIKKPEAIKYLHDNDSPCLVITTGHFSRDWGTMRDPNTIDLRDIPEFKEIWDSFDTQQDKEEE